MTGKCRLNNMNMRNVRKDSAYQCLVIDLAMLGVVSKEECEMLIGCGIPKGLVLPNGTTGNLISESSIPEQPAETEETEETEDDEGRTESNN
jgi:hypothetical protein